ncbi:MAG TPA: VanW family protein [Tetrasphaera sp.]|uniref:VanW family protein n=1 Tax=Nostocoides sp. TaxID=1917966 RepID=UPI002C1A6FC6|nr:VanW family protein [Tetrasphaera sp.]HNQ05779.1 VanW family protein [Tetrasphaera sp.]
MDATTARQFAQRWAGPWVRRAKREWHWRRCGADLDLHVATPDDFPYAVMQHSTPMLRQLQGLPMQLQHNKITNLRLAVAPLDGRVLLPGQRLSFWKIVGNPNAKRGFLEGVVLDEGTLRPGVGGGLCQLTNLIYWMTLHTPLTVVERWRHTYDVFPDNARTQPFASGATCAYPALDLQIENRTDAAYRLSLSVGQTHLVGAWSSDRAPTQAYRIYEAMHVITNEAPAIYMRRNIIRRKVLNLEGVEIGDELVTENHAQMMYEPFLPAAPVRVGIEA